MFNFFTEIRVLRQEGTLHTKLLFRVRLLFIISFILLGVVAYAVLSTAAYLLVVVALAVIGFLLGLYVFSRMNVVNWNEQEEILEAGKMDLLGYLTLALYIIIEISFRTLLKEYYPASATAYILAGVFGTILGRAVGTIVTIHKVFRAAHPD